MEHRDKITIRFAVKEQGMAKIKRTAIAVSDPASAQYGQHLTTAEIDAITRPKEADIDAVTSWLRENAIAESDMIQRKSSVVVTCTISEAESLLQTRFRHMTNPKTGQHALRAGDAFIPDNVRAALQAVYGLHGFPLPPRRHAAAGGSAAAARRLQPNQAAVSPADLRAAYSVSGVKPSGSTKNRQAVAEFQGQAMRPDDLTSFFSKYVKNYTAGTDDVVFAFQGDSGGNTTFPGIEASLDVQWIMGIAPHIKTEFCS